MHFDLSHYKSFIGLTILITSTLAVLTFPETIIIENRDLNLFPDSTFLIAKVTGYTSDVSETDDSPLIMASNKKVYSGAIACPRSLKFGSIVKIDNLVYTCEDRTNKRIDGVFDIWFPDKRSALEFGSRIKVVELRD